MNIKNRIIAFMIAFLITVSPLQRSFQVSADEALEDNDLPAEETWSHVSADAEDRKDAGSAGCWTGTDVTEPDGHEEPVAEEPVAEEPVVEEPVAEEPAPAAEPVVVFSFIVRRSRIRNIICNNLIFCPAGTSCFI